MTTGAIIWLNLTIRECRNVRVGSGMPSDACEKVFIEFSQSSIFAVYEIGRSRGGGCIKVATVRVPGKLACCKFKGSIGTCLACLKQKIN